MIPPSISKQQAAFTYATEGDLLNVVLFGTTAKEWREVNTKLDGNIRDHATIEQLVVLSNQESLPAVGRHQCRADSSGTYADQLTPPTQPNSHQPNAELAECEWSGEIEEVMIIL